MTGDRLLSDQAPSGCSSPATSAPGRAEALFYPNGLVLAEESQLRLVADAGRRRIEIRRREGRNWSTETRVAGEIIQIHGLDVAVDAIDA